MSIFASASLSRQQGLAFSDFFLSLKLYVLRCGIVVVAKLNKFWVPSSDKERQKGKELILMFIFENEMEYLADCVRTWRRVWPISSSKHWSTTRGEPSRYSYSIYIHFYLLLIYYLYNISFFCILLENKIKIPYTYLWR